MIIIASKIYLVEIAKTELIALLNLSFLFYIFKNIKINMKIIS